MHREQRLYCEKADKLQNEQMCKDKPKWCFFHGGPRCENAVGDYCSTKLCQPDELASECVPKGKWQMRCPSDSRPLDRGKIADLEKNKWLVKKLSAYTLSLQKKELSKNLIEKMPLKDRRLLCGNISSKCSLAWHEDEYGRGWGKCRVEEDPCSGCVYRYEKKRCQAKNLCNGVICL